MAGIRCLRKAPASQRLLDLFQKRSYAASALPLQHNYEDDEDEEEEEDEIYGLAPTIELGSNGAQSEREVRWVFIGNPSVKKHWYAERVSKLLEVPYISMATLVHQDLNPRSSLYRQIAKALNQRKTVPRNIVFGLLLNKLEEGYDRGETGFILDGIPRSVIQAEILDHIVDIDLAVNFKCTEDCLLEKLLESRSSSHRASGSTGNLGLANLHHGHMKSSNMEDTLKQKLRIYAEQRKPLENYYRNRKKLLDFKVASSPGDTWKGLLAALNLQFKYASIVHRNLKS